MKQYFKKYNDFLNESLSSARKKFVDGGLIPQEDFNTLADIDPTPTKKYLEKMCSWYIEGVELEEFVEPIKKFHRLLPRLEQKDINKYGTFQEFKDLLDSTESKTSIKKGITKHIKVIFENDDIQITQPKTYEQSCLLGAGTRWCTASSGTKSHWENYTISKGLKLYYIWFKKVTDKKNYKMAITVNFGGKIVQIFDAEDKEVTKNRFEKLMNSFDIPMSLFTSHSATDKKKYTKDLEQAIVDHNVRKIVELITSLEYLQTKSNLERLIPKFEEFGRTGHSGLMEIIVESKKYHTEDVFLLLLEYFKHRSTWIGVMIRKVPEFQSDKYFKMYVDINPNFDDVIQTFVGVPELRTPKIFIYFIKELRIYNNYIKELLGKFPEFNNEVIHNFLMDYYGHDVESVRNLMLWIEDLRTEENYQKFLKLNPSTAHIYDVLNISKNLQTPKNVEEFLKLPDITPRYVLQMMLNNPELRTEEMYEFVMAMTPSPSMGTLMQYTSIDTNFNPFDKKYYKQ